MSEAVFRYSSKGINAKLLNSSRNLVGDLSFCIGEGEKVALIGETGSGKTLTALSIMGLLPDNLECSVELSLVMRDGSIISGEKAFGEVGKSIVYIPQNGLEFLDHGVSIRRHMLDMLRTNGYPRHSAEGEALERLRLVGFGKPDEIMEMYPFQLSGGMAQRVTIALAMTGRARLVIADEPTNGLDRNGRKSFISLLDQCFPEAGKLLITHDIALSSLADRVLVLKNGILMEEGPSEEVLSSPRSPYTRALIDALVENGMVETPILRKDDPSCPFYSRCPEACPSCASSSGQSEGSRYWRCRA